MRIGVFDSGVGGLSVLTEIARSIPSARYFYCCDNLNFPYGTKDQDSVKQCATSVVGKFFGQVRPDLLVVACNTASTIALEDIRKLLPIPVVGVVPAIKPAAELSVSRHIGILATPATVQRASYLDDLISKYASDCKVVRQGSSACVIWAEEKLRGKATDLTLLASELSVLKEAAGQGMDQLVLGCTHFPLLADEIGSVLPESVRLIDSGQAIAQRVLALLRENFGLASEPGTGGGEVLVEGYCSGAGFTLDLKSLGINGLGTLMLRTLA